jgi:hypothetical protein
MSASHHAGQPDWDAWSRLMAGLWQGMALSLDLQQQVTHRWALRQQEAGRHWQHASLPLTWMDMSLAGMRWGLQEWDQAMQDGMAMPVLLRGEASPLASPWLGLCSQWTQAPWQAWAQCWAWAGRERCR